MILILTVRKEALFYYKKRGSLKRRIYLSFPWQRESRTHNTKWISTFVEM